MINIAASIDANQRKKEWYQAKLDTSDLIQKVVSCLHVGSLSSDDLWYLFRLTWGTPRKNRDHWKTLKAPALAHLFGKRYQEHSDIYSTIAGMQLPDAVTSAAVRSICNGQLLQGAVELFQGPVVCDQYRCYAADHPGCQEPGTRCPGPIRSGGQNRSTTCRATAGWRWGTTCSRPRHATDRVP